MVDDSNSTALADGYRRWAEVEARDSSPQYESWAQAIASAPEALERIGALPIGKRQPNLVFAAARLNGAPAATSAFVAWILENWSLVEATALARATQTNEPARCAPLLVALSQLEGPISLIEVGASAGLCLIPDRYGYRFTHGRTTRSLGPAGDGSLVIECAVEGTEAPARMPDIVWRAGLDLNPVDLSDADERSWMETLIWPEHAERRDRFRRAVDVLREDPPIIFEGDLVTELSALVARAPTDSTVVIMHSAVFAYLDDSARAAAESVISRLDARRVSLEGVQALPDVAARLPSRPVGKDGDFVLALDGVPLGYAAPHGGRFVAL